MKDRTRNARAAQARMAAERRTKAKAAFEAWLRDELQRRGDPNLVVVRSRMTQASWDHFRDAMKASFTTGLLPILPILPDPEEKITRVPLS